MTLADLTLKPRGLTALIGCSTLILVILAGLIRLDILPLNLELNRSGPRYWHFFVALSGLVLPLGILIGQRKHLRIAAVLKPYLILLGVQILTEGLFSLILPTGFAVIIGTVYSPLRMLQLGLAYRQLIQPLKVPRWFAYGVLFLLGIWSINLVRLLLLSWPQLWSEPG